MNRYLNLTLALWPAIGFTAILILVRMIYSGSQMYVFLAWNIFLACVPLLFSRLLPTFKTKKFYQLLLFGAWLLFFPNSLYIITDLVHLRARPPVPLWYDIILVFSAAANGLLVAFISLSDIEKFLRTKFNFMQVRFILMACLFAGSFGVYLGRYLRLNSWDIITNPVGVISGISKMIIYPHENLQTWYITCLLSIFFAAIYFTIQKFRTLNRLERMDF